MHSGPEARSPEAKRATGGQGIILLHGLVFAGRRGLVGRAGDARTSCPGGEFSRRGNVVAAGLDRVGEVEREVTAHQLRYHQNEFSR